MDIAAQKAEAIAQVTEPDELGRLDVRVGPVPARCRDGFLMSFWDRPELVLDPEARLTVSASLAPARRSAFLPARSGRTPPYRGAEANTRQ
jgi:hypothetical protein